MAKAKKPVSGSKSTSKSVTDKAAPDAVAKSDATPDAKQSVKSEVAKSAAAAAKPAEAKAAAATKSVESSSSVPKTSKSPTPAKTGADAGKADDSGDAAKTATPAKAAGPETKGDPVKKPEAATAKPLPEKPAPAKATAPVSKPAPPAAQPEPKKSVFWPLVMGGVIAGVIGFGVSEMNVLNTRVDTDAIKSDLAAQQGRIATLEEVEPVEPVDLSGLETSIASLSDMVTSLEERLAELEARPVVTATGEVDVAAIYADEFEALQSSVAAQKDEIQRLLDDALSVEQATEQAAQAAMVQGALTTITAALATGEGFGEAVDVLNDSGIDDVPPVLAENAGGVPMIQTLQADFPDSARAALSAVRSSGDDGAAAGVGSFLRRQLGARSVAPREGSDPDAILSRAEAAVRDGDLETALTEIDALPEGAKAALADWLAAAETRAATQAAVQDLSQRLTAN